MAGIGWERRQVVTHGWNCRTWQYKAKRGCKYFQIFVINSVIKFFKFKAGKGCKYFQISVLNFVINFPNTEQVQ